MLQERSRITLHDNLIRKNSSKEKKKQCADKTGTQLPDVFFITIIKNGNKTTSSDGELIENVKPSETKQ